MTLRISSNFDSGAIEVLSIDKPDDIRLRLRADQGVGGDSGFRQWFHFRLHGAAGQDVRLVGVGRPGVAAEVVLEEVPAYLAHLIEEGFDGGRVGRIATAPAASRTAATSN